MRPVDAEALEKKISKWLKISEWLGQPGNGDYYSGYDAALCAVQDLIADTPTLTQPNEPLTLEQVKKVFPGCEMCREKKKVKSDNFCGAATMQIVGDSIDLCGDKKKIKFFGHIYAPSFSVKFCPFCSRPLTDEAVQMVMERLEALYE